MFSEEAHISILFNGELFAKEVIEEIKVLESYLFDADGNRHVITEQISLASFYADENGNIMIKDIKCDGNDHLALRNYKNEHWGEIVPGINASEYIGTAATAPENLDTTYEKICLANDIIKAAGDDKLPPIEDILVFKREDGSFVTLFDYSDIGESKPLSCFDIVYTVLCGHAPTADEDIAATIIEDVTSLNLPSYFLNDLMVEYGHVFFKGNNVQNLSNDRLLNTVERLVIESKTFN